MKVTSLLLAVAFFFPTFVFAKSLEEGQKLGSPNGRYVLGQISNFRRDQYLLDTKTGKVWSTADIEGFGTVFQPAYFACGTELWSDSPSCSNPFKYVPKKKEEAKPFPQGAQE